MMICGNFSLRMNTMKMTETGRKRRPVLLLLCLVFAVSAAVSYLCPDSPQVRVFRYGTGWGYDIFYNGRKIIHQPYVPAIPGNNPFPDRRSARKAGMYVMSKIRSGSSPAVSAEEIMDLMPSSRR